MKFVILRETLLKLLRIVSGVVERRQQHAPVLANVLFKINENSLSIVGTDQEVEIISTAVLSDIKETGTTTVPFRKLNDICKALPENTDLLFETQDDKIIIKCSRSKFALTTLPAEQFPDVQTINKDGAICSFVVSQKQFRWLVTKTAFAMADQDVRYFLNGMLLEVKDDKLFSVAADGHRLAMNFIDLSQNISPVRIIVPRKGILEIMRMLDEGEDDLQLTMVANHLQVKCGEVTVTTKLLDGKFPDYERVIPRNGEKIVIGNRERLKEAFHRAAALFNEKFRSVRLRVSPSSLMVLASNTEQDQVEELLEVDYGGEDIEVGFNIRYLLDFLSVAQSEFVKFTMSDANKSTLIEEVGNSSKGAYVLMPVRT